MCNSNDAMVKQQVTSLKVNTFFEVIQFRKNRKTRCFKNIFANIKKCV